LGRRLRGAASIRALTVSRTSHGIEPFAPQAIWRHDPSMVDTTARDDRSPTVLESALRYDRAPVVVLLIVLPLVSWMWIVVMARDMYGPMTGASAWMMTAVWDVRHLALLWAMWAVMMVGMMLPSASPMLLLYGVVARRSATGASAASRQIYALAAGYLAVWVVFSLGATALQRLLATRLLVSPMMEVTSSVAGATLLLIAGVYQLTPIKQACLRTCQSPLGFLMSRWRPGWAGAFRMGLEHGALCVGCCWALMLLLFAGGVMNLAVIAALTALVAFEKLTPFGARGARISGVLLMAAAVWMLVH
jgi:predicted metal-binding membrane protein